MPRIRRRLFAAALAVTAVAVTGCSSTVSLTPATDANNPHCAEVTVRLPGELGGLSRRWTDAQATGAWGDPASVIVTCGVDVPAASTLPCKTVDGVDWIIDDSDAPKYRVTSFGRTPAVQVYLDNDVVSSADVLDALSRIVGVLPTEGPGCTDATATLP